MIIFGRLFKSTASFIGTGFQECGLMSVGGIEPYAILWLSELSSRYTSYNPLSTSILHGASFFMMAKVSIFIVPLRGSIEQSTGAISFTVI